MSRHSPDRNAVRSHSTKQNYKDCEVMTYEVHLAMRTHTNIEIVIDIITISGDIGA